MPSLRRGDGRLVALWSAVAVVSLLFITARAANAQFGFTGPAELSDALQVDEADSAARTLLQRAKAHAAEKQWDEAIETLRQVMEHHGERLVRVDPHRYLSMREYCQMQLSQLPAEGLAMYRGRIDAQAKRLYEQGVAERDEKLLRRVVDELFVSSWGDKALWMLGEMELERGNYEQARGCWQRIKFESGGPGEIEREGTAGLRPPLADEDKKKYPPPYWLAYPDSQIDLAEARARLALVSIMEGSLVRAEKELAELERLHPRARDRMAGRDAQYAETLRRLFALAQQRPEMPLGKDWATFAGATTRTARAALRSRFGAVAWEVPLASRPFQADMAVVHNPEFKLPEFRVGEEQRGLLSFHPLVVDDIVLFNTAEKVFALKLKTGKPAWPVAPNNNLPAREPGEIFNSASGHDIRPDPIGGGVVYHAYGAPRFTMTARDHRLYARLGSPITAHPVDQPFVGGGSYLVCLDLAAEGYLRWRIPEPGKEDERWAFEGSPVCDGVNVYVAMRRSDIRPQEHVACFDAQTGAMRWRRLVCAAESPARGQIEEMTHNLLTLAEGVLYLNTNLGAIAALSTSDGHINWLYRYERSKHSTDAGGRQFYRDLNPCVFDRGRVFAAPADTPAIFALDAATGELLWENRKAGDATQLLGVVGENLIASGRRLYWLDIEHGDRRMEMAPDQPTISGYGRGALIGDLIYWPTRSELRIYRQDYAAARSQDVPDPIPIGGGNLVAAGEYLLVATPDRLIAYGPSNGQPAMGERPLVIRQSSPGASVASGMIGTLMSFSNAAPRTGGLRPPLAFHSRLPSPDSRLPHR